MAVECFSPGCGDDHFMSTCRFLYSQRSTVVSVWLQSLLSADISRPSEEVLDNLFSDMLMLLCEEPLNREAIKAFGRDLFDLYAEQPAAFGEIQNVVGRALVAVLPSTYVERFQDRLIVFFSWCTSGFLACMCASAPDSECAVMSYAHVEASLEAVSRHASLGLFIFDDSQIVRYVGGKQFHHLDGAEGGIVGQSVIVVLPDPDVSYHMSCVFNGECFTTIFDVAGTVLRARYEPLLNEAGRVVGGLCVVGDMTWYTYLEEQVFGNDSGFMSHVSDMQCSGPARLCMSVANGNSQHHHTADVKKQLSTREIEILQLIARGKSNKEIASSLVISHTTVKWHLERIFRKLDVHNRTVAAVYAQSIGILNQCS